MTLSVALGVDHGGFPLKYEMINWIRSEGHVVVDLGASRLDPNDDYPDFAISVARKVASGETQRGILICGSGVGACIAANKILGIRAGVCHDTYSARQGVEHDDMNVLCLGARVIGSSLAVELVKAFLNASFSGEARHRRRLAKILSVEGDALKGNADQNPEDSQSV